MGAVKIVDIGTLDYPLTTNASKGLIDNMRSAEICHLIAKQDRSEKVLAVNPCKFKEVRPKPEYFCFNRCFHLKYPHE